MDEYGQIVKEQREFMAWTRSTLQCVKDLVHEVEKHQKEQNGAIKLVMERERQTHDCTARAHEQALKNARDIVALKVMTQSEKEHDREREGEMRRDVDWIKENVWKLALGGVSLLALLDQALALAQKLGAP